MKRVTLGGGKAVHYSTTPDGFMASPACGGNRASERYVPTDADVTCKRCAKILAAEAEREERLNRDPRGDEWMGRTIGDAVTVTLHGRTFDTELTGADHITPGWTVAYVDEDGQRNGTFVVVTDADIQDGDKVSDPRKDAFDKARALGMDWAEALDYANAKTAEMAQPTHVSSVESATHDNDDNKGTGTMATKKLKLKDVRGDVRIGAVPGADAIHALRNAVDENGRNLPMCRTRTKNPIQYWGPAAEQKPELELCAGCSKVVPTGEVSVSEESVEVPGLSMTVSQKSYTPVEGDDKGENMAAKNDTQDVDAQISAVHGHVDNIKTAETVEAVKEAAEAAEGIITTLPTKHRNTLRSTVKEARTARETELTPVTPEAEAAKAEVESRRSADVAEDFNDIEGVPDLIKDGVKLFSQGVDLGLKLTNAGEKLAHVMLTMRQKIVNPATGLPDLTAERKTTKNAAAEVYAQAKKRIADDDVERQGAHNSLVRATQNKASDVLVDWLRAFDGPDRKESLAVASELFGDKLDGLKDDASISEAIYRLYAGQGIELPRYGRTELARYDRRVKAIEGATKELETLTDGDKDANPKDVEALEEKIKELKAEVPEEILTEKLEPKAEKSDAEKTADALKVIRAQVDKAGKRFAKVKTANEKRKAKAELYSIIRAAADAFDLDLSALVTADEDE
ncbi:unnamed protein product [Lomovskayavirus C31]|uniref:Repressor protein C n=1 Tax=Streptomyces phage phiC31 TaxID=10719 RepID=RPC_BPPHC|nr:repressor [Lomovskayavirus C31]P08979.1 RecName: Full=Repressor protein C [Lomovskayavirus C31]CAA07123.2 repressor [Lomovskayavirus C31]CAA31345.1 unnamed protein product [Lomovskayavirus C31]CAA53911.1 unnamed protein product [Lomovskayavirus C31]prf//1515345A repressor [Lomovskayavirus C31]